MLWNHHPAPLSTAEMHAADELPPAPARPRPERSTLSATTVDLVLAYDLEDVIGPPRAAVHSLPQE